MKAKFLLFLVKMSFLGMFFTLTSCANQSHFRCSFQNSCTGQYPAGCVSPTCYNIHERCNAIDNSGCEAVFGNIGAAHLKPLSPPVVVTDYQSISRYK